MSVRWFVSRIVFFTAACVLVPSGAAFAEQGISPGRPSLAPPKARPDWGTVQVTYVQVPGVAFAPQNSQGAFDTTGDGFFGQVLRTGQPLGMRLAAPIQMPDGALVRYLELDYCDNSGAGQMVSGGLVESDYVGNVVAYVGDLLSDGLGCFSSYVDTTNYGMVVDNFNHHYWLVSNVNYNLNYTIGLAGMIVGYQLQVSPAPTQPTFNDVPPSHPFFQFIEALAAAGITGGCGGGKYCPDSPVTRGQMAVFLAKALGLSWP